MVVVTSVQSQKHKQKQRQQSRKQHATHQSRSGCPCICILHWPLPSAAPGPDPCALGRETVAPPVQDEPCTGGDGLLGLWVRTVHCVADGPEIRHSKVQSVWVPMYPNLALFFPSPVHVLVRRGSRYLAVGSRRR